MQVTEERMKDIAEDAAERAATKVLSTFFSALDIDLQDKKGIIKLREDLTYLARQRQGSDDLKAASKKWGTSLAFAALAGIVWLVWDIFKDGIWANLKF